MIVALSASEVWTALLVVGIVASFVTVVMIVGAASAKRQASVASVVAELPPGSLARTIRDTAAAKAAKAAVAAQHRPGHTLTNVHSLLPTGQTPTVANDLRHGSDVTKEASEILVHFAEHDPKRIAEVIKLWIQVDENMARKLRG